MNTLVVPLDGSATAERILPHVGLLAALLSARVHLLLVVTHEQKQHLIAGYAAAPPQDGARYETEWQWEDRAQAELMHAAEGYLTEQAQALRTAELNVTWQVTSGVPAECIIDCAASEPEALIVMATHGYSGLRRWTLGSVADKVIHGAQAPIFLIRTTEPAPVSVQPWKRILVPLDGSALAAQALPLAIDLARRAKAELILLQAVMPLVEYVPGLSPFHRLPSPPVVFPDALREQAHQQLMAVIDRLALPNMTITPVAVAGYPAEAIVDEAVRYQAGLIVMATHGYSGLQRWTLGSVADKVLHTSTLPLLLVRNQVDTDAINSIPGYPAVSG